MNIQCRDELHLKYEIIEDFVDGIEVHFEHNAQRFSAFVLSRPSAGFLEVQQKLFHAFKYKHTIHIHGIELIKRFGASYQYFIEIKDIDLIDPISAQPRKLLPFYISTEPNNEKETVFSLFFANLAYMQSYLDFSDYTIQKTYPDLAITNGIGIRYIEFEYDAANFYKHGHDVQSPPCDLIIAWQNTGNKSDIPILLLSSLHNTYITEQSQKIIDETESRSMLDLFMAVTSILFKIQPSESLLLFILPFIVHRPLTTLIPFKKITICIKNGTKEDEKVWSEFRKLFSKDITPFEILFGRDIQQGITSDVILSIDFIRDPHPKNMDKIDAIPLIQKFLHRIYLLGKSLPSLLTEKGIYSLAMEKCGEIEMANIVVTLAGIFSAIIGRIAINSNDVEIMYRILCV